MESVRNLIDKKTDDSGPRLRGRYVTISTRTQTIIKEERRDHTVLNAKRHTLAEYTGRVPKRIAQLINAIPPEIRPFVDIIDGTVSKETLTRRTIKNEIVAESHSVWVDDPTPALFGAFALAGWGGSTSEKSRATYVGHRFRVANRWLAGSVLAAAAAAMLIARVAGPRNALIAAVAFAIIIAGHQFNLRWEARSMP
jgi:hypothetical protein